MDGSDAGDVSSTAADEVPLIADHELLQPNASSPLTGPTENDDDVALKRLFALRNERLFSESRDGDGGGDPRHADADAEDDDDDDAYGGFRFSLSELPQLNASPPPPPPPPTPTENDVAFLRRFGFARVFSRLMASRGPNTDTRRSAAIFSDTRGGDGGGDPPHGNVDADAGADDDEDEDDDDAYGGFGFSFGAVPASGVAMACLPATTVGDGETMDRGECAVCLEEYEAGDELRTMPCAHGFHERCIFQWLRLSRLCPLCRFALPAEEGTEEEDDVEDVYRTYYEDDNDDGALDQYLR